MSFISRIKKWFKFSSELVRSNSTMPFGICEGTAISLFEIFASISIPAFWHFLTIEHALAWLYMTKGAEPPSNANASSQ